MLVSLDKMKSYIGINPTPVILQFDINATTRKLIRASGDWTTQGVAVGKKITLGGFSNSANNVQITVEAVTALEITYKTQTPVLVTETGNPLNTFRVDYTDYDDFLTTNLDVISQAVEEYCRRKFLSATYKQTWYEEDLPSHDKLFTFHFPLTAVASVKVDGSTTAVDTDYYRVNKDVGLILPRRPNFPNVCEKIEIEYTAGYTTLPATIEEVVCQLVQERYNKKKAGIQMNFGSDVQRVSVPGVISIDFDYSLQTNERKSALGVILGNMLNVLDSYRSERTIIGDGKIEYVETL